MNEQPITTVRLRSPFFDAGKLDLYHLTGGEYILKRLTSELRIHGVDDRAWKIQLELDATLSGENCNQLVTWAFLEPNSSPDFYHIFQESREKNQVYKASFTLDSASFQPVTSRIFTPHFLFSSLRDSPHISPLLEFFRQSFTQSVLSGEHFPLVVMFIYRCCQQDSSQMEPLPVIRSGNDACQFVLEIGLPQQCANLMHHWGYTDLRKIIYHMNTKERGKMFQKCQFSSRERAHFVGICMEYADQLGQPIGVIY